MSDEFDLTPEDIERLLEADPSEDDLRRRHDEVKSWLEKRVSFAEVDAEYMGMDIWETLKGRMIEGDELWEYCSPGDTSAWPYYEAGVALVRDGQVIDDITTHET